MCEYKQYCKCDDCDGYPEEPEVLYCLDAYIEKIALEIKDND